MDDKIETLFFLGKITRIEIFVFWILHYDANGKWDKEYPIEYSEIFKIEFNDLYARYFNAYMKDRLPENTC